MTEDEYRTMPEKSTDNTIRDEEVDTTTAIDTARNYLTYSIMGFIFAIGAFALKNIILSLLGFILENGKSLVIAVNKWDGMDPYKRDKTRATLDRRLNFIPFIRIHAISALHGTGVGNLFDSINEAYQSANKKLSTPQLTKILRTALETHTPPLVRGRRIKLRYAHAGGHQPPLIIVHGNQVKSVPDTYKRYLANTFQQKLKLTGTPVKIEFKGGENPYSHKKNKKKRLVRQSKKK